jgi:hypothetical protein
MACGGDGFEGEARFEKSVNVTTIRPADVVPGNEFTAIQFLSAKVSAFGV